MTASDIVVVISAAGAPLALIGGGVAWIARRIDKLDERVQAAERKSVKLERGYNRVIIQVQRWRTAFQIVAAELQRLQPDNPALSIAQSMLLDQVADDEEADDHTKSNEELLYTLKQETSDVDAL